MKKLQAIRRGETVDKAAVLIEHDYRFDDQKKEEWDLWEVPVNVSTLEITRSGIKQTGSPPPLLGGRKIN